MCKLKNVVVVLCALSLMAAFSASEIECADRNIKVIGAGIVKKGTVLPLIDMSTGKPAFGTVKSFEDQPVYILEKMEPEPGVHRGGYLADGDSFKSDCRIHGLEVMGEGLLIIPIEEVEKGNIKIEIF